jgi:hypothetical protein
MADLPVENAVARDALRQVSLEHIAQNYEILAVQDGVVLMTPLPHMQLDERGMKMATTIANPNAGAVAGSVPDVRIPVDNFLKASSPSINRVEYNMDLRGMAGRRVFDQMRRSDATVRMSLNVIKTPILAGRWFIEPYDSKKRSQTIADFVWWNLQEAMAMTWMNFIQEALLEMDFGFYAFEKVWSIKMYKKKPMVVCSLEPRHPLDIIQADYDTKGRFQGFQMWGNPYDAEVLWMPMEKLIVFTYNGEAGDVEGISALRSVYKHWYYSENLYKIDGIQKERHGIGIPCVKLPLGHTPNDVVQADQIGRNLRTNEKAHVVLPPNWDIMMLKLEGQHVDALASAHHHKHEIAKNVLAPFVDSERGLIDESTSNFFLKGSRHEAEMIAQTLTRGLIPELVDFNWPGVGEYPKLKVRRIGDTADWRTISFAVRNLVGSNILRPDDKLEEWFREEMDLSPVDEATVRQTATPQAPGTGGPGGTPGGARPPRQAPASGGMQQGRNAGGQNNGNDASGGRP